MSFQNIYDSSRIFGKFCCLTICTSGGLIFGTSTLIGIFMTSRYTLKFISVTSTYFYNLIQNPSESQETPWMQIKKELGHVGFVLLSLLFGGSLIFAGYELGFS